MAELRDRQRPPRRRRGDHRAQPPRDAERLERAARARPAGRGRPRSPRTTRVRAVRHHRRRAARSPRAPTCATCRAARTARPRAIPTCAGSCTERYHPIITGDPRRMPKPVRGGRQRPGGRHRAARWRSPRDLIVAAESAYFLLAFVNIGLVPDGGSSLFVPDARRVRARGRDGDARRADPGRRRRSSGA